MLEPLPLTLQMDEGSAGPALVTIAGRTAAESGRSSAAEQPPLLQVEERAFIMVDRGLRTGSQDEWGPLNHTLFSNPNLHAWRPVGKRFPVTPSFLPSLSSVTLGPLPVSLRCSGACCI